jgi:hypothetical protein
MQRISSLAEWLLGSQKGVCSMEWVSYSESTHFESLLGVRLPWGFPSFSLSLQANAAIVLQMRPRPLPYISLHPSQVTVIHIMIKKIFLSYLVWMVVLSSCPSKYGLENRGQSKSGPRWSSSLATQLRWGHIPEFIRCLLQHMRDAGRSK